MLPYISLGYVCYDQAKAACRVGYMYCSPSNTRTERQRTLACLSDSGALRTISAASCRALVYTCEE